MGLWQWLTGFGLPAQIAKNARTQYLKHRARVPEMSEAEIAQAIFTLRYMSNLGNLNDDEATRFAAYMDAGFECESLFDFCLVSLDIEGGTNPEHEFFLDAAESIQRRLEARGHVVDAPHPVCAERFRTRWLLSVRADRRRSRMPEDFVAF